MILIFFGVTAGSFVLPNFSLPLAEGTYICNYNFMRSNFLNHYPSSKISIDKAFTKKLHFLKKNNTETPLLYFQRCPLYYFSSVIKDSHNQLVFYDELSFVCGPGVHGIYGSILNTRSQCLPARREHKHVPFICARVYFKSRHPYMYIHTYVP